MEPTALDLIPTLVGRAMGNMHARAHEQYARQTARLHEHE